jgi:glucan phosphoethanolaminetransferase (alkaline phosphatase superfamily)
MALRLFHVTEFAQSTLSPAAQRSSWHPTTVLTLISLWLTVAGNLPLWREIARAPDAALAGHGGFSLGLYLALLCFTTLGLLLTVLNWAPLLKLSATVLLWLCAVNAELLWTGQTILRWDLAHLQSNLGPLITHLSRQTWWQHLLFLGLLAALPSLWLWNLNIRRVRLGRRLPQNLLLALVWAAALAALWFIGRNAFLPLLQTTHWGDWLSPFNTLLGLLR